LVSALPLEQLFPSSGQTVRDRRRAAVIASPFGFLPPFVPVLEPQNFLDVQLVFTSAAILRDFVDQHRDLGDWAIHPIEEA
jgi:hypothetical protein